MGPSSYFSMSMSVSKGRSKPWLQKFKTYGKYKVIQFGVLGLFVQFNYGRERDS